MRGAAVAVLALTVVAAAAQTPPAVPLPGVEVVATTPLPGLGAPLSEVPGNVQVFGGREIGRQRPATVADFLDANASSVNLNTATGNPFQPDLNFRGFTASPLLGTPQGLSVFQDGVRINEVFGDVVNWDLVPPAAIASIQVIPGSNPIFGLNTLGGALAVYTKNGRAYPGTTVDASGGSFGRGALGFETGGASDALDGYATGSYVYDRGWREHSSSRVRQLFGKLGWRSENADAAISATLADNLLNGTQTLPLSMLSTPQQAYTWPDSTENRLAFVNAQASRTFGDLAVATGNAYFRQLTSDGGNSNVNGDVDPNDPASPPAFFVTSTVASRGWGGAAQLALLPALGGHRNRLTVGAAADLGDTDFTQTQQAATITPERETPGFGPAVPTADVRTATRNVALYATDTIAFADGFSATASVRWNDASVTLSDRSGTTPDLNGSHSYSRVNPAAGGTWSSATTTVHANWSQGMRVPSPVELACADPNAPCTLPNVFVADPPLAPVVATTLEAGARGTWGAGVSWSAAAYRTDLRDDVQFVAAGKGAVNRGYFQNIGRTRRQGVELGAAAPLGDVMVSARYSYTQATFQSAFVESSPNNSTANVDGDIVVAPGDSLPAIPRQLLKLRTLWTPREALALGATLVAASRQYARGNENNLDPAGVVPGYAAVNLDFRWQLEPRLALVANVGNLFNTRYQNFGILGANFFRGPGNTYAPALAAPEEFRAPAAPFGVWIGIQYAFSEKTR